MVRDSWLVVSLRNILFQAPIPEFQAHSPELQVPIPEFQVPIPEFQVPIPEFQAPIPELHAPIPELQVPIPEFQVPSPEFQAPNLSNSLFYFDNSNKNVNFIFLKIIRLKMGLFGNKKKKDSKQQKPKVIKQMKGKKTDLIEFTELMTKAALEPVYRSDFYRRILDEEFFVILAGADLPDGEVVLSEIGKFILATLPDGKVPIFTQLNRIYDKEIVKSEIRYMKIKADFLFNMVAGNTLIINPFSNYSKLLTPEEIEKIKSGTVLYDTSRSREVTRNEKMAIGQPKEYNMDLIEALKIQYTDHPGIKSAYIAMVQYVDRGLPPNLIIAVDTDEEFDEIANDTGFTAEQFLENNEIIEVMKLDKSSHFYGYFINAVPFYTSPYYN